MRDNIKLFTTPRYLYVQILSKPKEKYDFGIKTNFSILENEIEAMDV